MGRRRENNACGDAARLTYLGDRQACKLHELVNGERAGAHQLPIESGGGRCREGLDDVRKGNDLYNVAGVSVMYAPFPWHKGLTLSVMIGFVTDDACLVFATRGSGLVFLGYFSGDSWIGVIPLGKARILFFK